jgi:hypothetical protein
MQNLSAGIESREFFVWVPPDNFSVQNNLGVVGAFIGGPIQPGTDTPASLMFVPNPNPVPNFISAFHLGVINNYRIEYELERHRFNSFRGYPSRFFAMFVLNSIADAQRYRELHEDHVRGRVLKRGITVGPHVYSLHDATWIDFLRGPGYFEAETMENVAKAYWLGKRAEDAALTSMGREWKRQSCNEVLLYGRLDFPNKDLSRSDV